MPFTIPTTLNITGIVQNITKSVTLSQENVHQVNLTIAPSTTDEEVFLDITDLSKVKSLFLTTSSPVTYNFAAGAGDDFPLNSAVMLLGGSAQAFQKIEEFTGGTLVVGQQYFIKTYVATDDFTNVGASSNATNIAFVAAGTTPTDWTNGSTLATRSNELTSIFITNPSTATTATFNAVMVISND
jgi:hypothetical protein